jgi:fructoselysine-6-P-deglycase FrlB-like protein
MAAMARTVAAADHLRFGAVSVTADEIASQPRVWRAAAARAGELDVLASHERLAILGCGTSYYVAQAIAVLREAVRGETDAFVASEAPLRRHYPEVLAISRSGTTTEVGRVLERLPAGSRRTLVTGIFDAALSAHAETTVVLALADEQSVVQTRFATTVIALARVALGDDVEVFARDAEQALAEPLPLDPTRYARHVFLGRGWCVGLAAEAALKTREMAQAWAESYPAMEYRHGPISVADAETAVWLVGPGPAGLSGDVAATGATVVTSALDPLAQLVQVQRAALALAEARGLDPDRPRHLTRSVMLDGPA